MSGPGFKGGTPRKTRLRTRKVEKENPYIETAEDPSHLENEVIQKTQKCGKKSPILEPKESD